MTILQRDAVADWMIGYAVIRRRSGSGLASRPNIESTSDRRIRLKVPSPRCASETPRARVASRATTSSTPGCWTNASPTPNGIHTQPSKTERSGGCSKKSARAWSRIAGRSTASIPKGSADDTALVEVMHAIKDEFEAYGWRRMQMALRHRGWMVNHKKIKRLMREHAITRDGSQAVQVDHLS